MDGSWDTITEKQVIELDRSSEKVLKIGHSGAPKQDNLYQS